MTAATAAAAPAGLAPVARCERLPSRATGVELLGELAGSAYRETPTLVRRRDGQLIKLTPLLYALLDAIDGRRDSTELANELTRRMGRRANAEDVEFLVERKLRPLGVLREAGGEEPEVARANPLLVLRPRVVVSRPELTHRITTPFVWLFRPTAIVPLLLAFAAISGWLLLDKGLSSALHQALYEPWLVLVVWALVVISAAFHEIGHAAACRYGGARPGVIGGGLYLIWPAFYTEVSDAYRLSRRGRLRVDLGGLYFSAIFAVAAAGLWRLTGMDALLLVVAIQLIQMARQLVPFIRADGYHILADLVGVPDLFAHLKPTLLGLLPTRWGRPESQALKPWARAIVSGWVFVTVPVLLAVLGMIILAFPRLAATAWDSMGLRWAEAGRYWAEGAMAGVAMSAISLALVALPVLSITYLVAYLSRRLGRRAWRGTAGRPRLRALALLGCGALAGLLVWAWWPGDNYRPIEAGERGPLPTILGPESFPKRAEVRRLSAPVTPLTAGMPRLVGPVLAVGGPPTAVAPTHPPVLAQPRTAAAPGPAARLARQPSAGAVAAAPPRSQAPAARGAPRAPAGPAPAPVPSSPPAERPAWPFPWEAPDDPNAGDNRAMAVNTVDGSALWDFSTSFLLLQTGEPVLQANEAHAYASCTWCVTGAVAFQVLLIVGEVDTIAPLNAAVAANYACAVCLTYAFAYQIVATLTGAPDAEVQQRLDLAMQRLRELEASAGSLTPSELYLALESIEAEVLDALAGLLAEEAGSVDSPQDAASPAEDGERSNEVPAEDVPPAPESEDDPGGGSSSEEAAPESSGTETEGETPPRDPATEAAGEDQARDSTEPSAGPQRADEESGSPDDPGEPGECVDDPETPESECPDEVADVADRPQE